MNLSSLNPLLADTALQPNTTGSEIKMFAMLGVMFVFMWFAIIHPQRKRTKELEAMLKALKAGDKIVLNSGIVGVVLALKDKTVSIRSNESKLEVLKSAIAEVTDRGGEAGAS
jgi:preprotein translocase subunit YajC